MNTRTEKNYVETYLQELKNGKQIRIKYNEPNYDYCDPQGWWKEELLVYDDELDQFKCYYPISSYDKDFYTLCNERIIKFSLREDIRDFNNDEDERIVADIIVEDCGVPSGSLSLREAAIERIKTMSDDEIRRRIFS